MIQLLNYQTDYEVRQPWIVAYNQATSKAYAYGRSSQSPTVLTELYQQMAGWLKGRSKSEIDRMVIAVFDQWRLGEIFNEAIPNESYSAVELLFHPEEPGPKYVVNHFLSFQQYCQDNGYTEPALSAATYRLAEAYLIGTSTDHSHHYFNTTDVFVTSMPDFSEYQLIFPPAPQTNGLELAKPVLNMQTAMESVYAKTFSDQSNSCYLADYLFLEEWVDKHHFSKPALWTKQQLIFGTTDFLIATHQSEWHQFLIDRQLEPMDELIRSDNYRKVIEAGKQTPNLVQLLNADLSTHPKRSKGFRR